MHKPDDVPVVPNLEGGHSLLQLDDFLNVKQPDPLRSGILKLPRQEAFLHALKRRSA
jgi:hypothetical protein